MGRRNQPGYIVLAFWPDKPRASPGPEQPVLEIQTRDTNHMVEEMMLLGNITVAEKILQVPSLHSSPSSWSCRLVHLSPWGLGRSILPSAPPPLDLSFRSTPPPFALLPTLAVRLFSAIVLASLCSIRKIPAGVPELCSPSAPRNPSSPPV